MVVKMSSPGRSFGGVADYCLHDPRMPGEAHHPESAERVEWTETRNLATSEGERAARIMAATAEASPDLKHLAGVAATGRKLEKPVCHYSLSWAKDERPGPARDAAGGGGEPEGVGVGETPDADRVAPRRTTPRARDREPGGPGERQGGGVEPEQAAPLEVGGRLRAGAGENPLPAAGEEQHAPGAGGAGGGRARAFGRPLAAGEDEPAAGAGSDPGGPGRLGWTGEGAGGLAAGGGAHALGAV